MPAQQNRYRYLTASGEPRGPAWLAEMRRLYQSGEIGPDTSVCRENDEEWGPAHSFIEITSDQAVLPGAPSSPAEHPRLGRISWGVWILVLLVVLFMAWVQFVYLQN